MSEFVFPERQARLIEDLDRLALAPPLVLLLEGGTPDEREAVALYWAARLNCTGGAKASACLECPSCRRILARADQDLILHDGREGPIYIDDVRETKVKLGQPPRGAGYRVVAFLEAQAMTIETPHSLLKALEEPRPGNVFVLTTPQRERLLQTIVSRAWVLTLAWPREADPPEAVREWLTAVAEFTVSGRNLIPRTSAKGALDRPTAMLVLAGMQRALTEALAGRPSSDLAWVLSERPLASLRTLGLVLDQGLEALDLLVNPALVVEWAAMRAHLS